MPTACRSIVRKEFYARDGVEISRNSMANWMGHVGFHLTPLADRILALIKEGERVYADETTLPTLSPGSGKTKTAWLWTYARDDRTFGGTAPPMVAYRFENGRGGECVERHLEGYAGLLQVDGWGAYNRLAEAKRRGGPLRLAACWAHLRRKFYELHVSGVSYVASETVERMAKLWKIEERIRGHDPDLRCAARQERSAAIVADLWPFWEEELARISGKSRLAEAIRYAKSRREALERFLRDGRLDIDSNAVERAIRPQTITRKNALFAGSDEGASYCSSRHALIDAGRFCWRSSGGGRRDRRGARLHDGLRCACKVSSADDPGSSLAGWRRGQSAASDQTTHGSRADGQDHRRLVDRRLAAFGALAWTMNGDVVLMAQGADAAARPAMPVAGRLAGVD